MTAANGQAAAIPRPEAGEVIIALGGRNMVMRPSFTAIARTEELTGMGLVELARLVSAKRFGVGLLAAIITPGLQEGSEPQASVDKVAELVFKAGVASEPLLDSVLAYLTNALNGGQEPEPEDSAPGKAKPAGTTPPTPLAG